MTHAAGGEGFDLEVAVNAIGAGGHEGDEVVATEIECAGVEAAGAVGEIVLRVVGDGGGFVPSIVGDAGEGVSVVIVPGFERGDELSVRGEKRDAVIVPWIKGAEAEGRRIAEGKLQGLRWRHAG